MVNASWQGWLKPINPPKKKKKKFPCLPFDISNLPK